MRLHLLGLPHTVSSPRFSHCAYTGKILRFPAMMRSLSDVVTHDSGDGMGTTGAMLRYPVTHYGVEGAETEADEQVDVLTETEWLRLGGHYPGTDQFAADLINVRHPVYQGFNRKLVPLLRERLGPRDIICLPFGLAHQQAMTQFRAPAGCFNPTKLETGIGYPVAFPRATDFFRVYESNAWMHVTLGREAERGKLHSGVSVDYEWVIPNYFDPDEWTLGTGSGGYLLYFGRLLAEKGLNEVMAIAKARPDLRVVLCGQGDPKPWLQHPNIEYLPPIHGAGRDKLLGDALCTLMPTRYIEPFGGVTVESCLTGTPVLGSTFGSFTETIEQGCNGFRCRSLADWLEAIAAVEAGDLDSRAQIRADAARRYSMWNLAAEYDKVFRLLDGLWTEGWYALPESRELAIGG